MFRFSGKLLFLLILNGQMALADGAACRRAILAVSLPQPPTGREWTAIGESGLFRTSDHQWVIWRDASGELRMVEKLPVPLAVRDIKVDVRSRSLVVIEEADSIGAANRMFFAVTYHQGRRYQRRASSGLYQGTYKRPVITTMNISATEQLISVLKSNGFKKITRGEQSALLFAQDGIAVAVLFQQNRLLGIYPLTGI